MKDDREKKVSIKDFEKFCKRIKDPEFDTISEFLIRISNRQSRDG